MRRRNRQFQAAMAAPRVATRYIGRRELARRLAAIGARVRNRIRERDNRITRRRFSMMVTRLRNHQYWRPGVQGRKRLTIRHRGRIVRRIVRPYWKIRPGQGYVKLVRKHRGKTFRG